jgi:hypothetical protein
MVRPQAAAPLRHRRLRRQPGPLGGAAAPRPLQARDDAAVHGTPGRRAPRGCRGRRRRLMSAGRSRPIPAQGCRAALGVTSSRPLERLGACPPVLCPPHGRSNTSLRKAADTGGAAACVGSRPGASLEDRPRFPPFTLRGRGRRATPEPRTAVARPVSSSRGTGRAPILDGEGGADRCRHLVLENASRTFGAVAARFCQSGD